MTGDPGLAGLDRFLILKNSKTSNIELLFLDGNKQEQSLIYKQTGEFLTPKALRAKFGGLNVMKSVLSLDETRSALERSINAATRLSRELPTDLQMESIPLKDLSSLVENVHVKTQEASQNTNLDMREFLGISKALQNIQGELLNNTSKLTDIDKRIQRDTKKLEEVENDPTYTDEQKRLYGDMARRLEYRKTGKARNTVTKSEGSLDTACMD